MVRRVRFLQQPVGYFIVVDGELVTDAGVGGVIKRLDAAQSIRDQLTSRFPTSAVEMFGVLGKVGMGRRGPLPT